MELYEIALLVVGALLLIAVVICWIKNKDLLGFGKVFVPVLSSLYTAMAAIGSANPNHAILSSVITILKAAIEATRMAEQMWLDGNIDKEQRNMYAKEYISEILEQAGICVTQEVEDIINGAIALTCALLPHEVNESEY